MLYKRKHSMPSSPELWKKAEEEARKRFRHYPSPYSSAWAQSWYKKRGGSWMQGSEQPAQSHANANHVNRTQLYDFEQYVDDDNTQKTEHPSKEIEKDKKYYYFREPLVDISRPVIDEAGTVIGFHPCGSNSKDLEQSKERYRTSYPKILPRSVAMRLNAIQREDLLRRNKAHQIAMQQAEEHTDEEE
jgi:hypothetical protein